MHTNLLTAMRGGWSCYLPAVLRSFASPNQSIIDYLFMTVQMTMYTSQLRWQKIYAGTYRVYVFADGCHQLRLGHARVYGSRQVI